MMDLELTAEEQVVLRQILEDCLSDLRIEIHRTDRLEYKEMLRARKAMLSRLFDKVAERKVSAV